MTHETVAAALRAAVLRYPKTEPTDAVKLLYQGTFGSGHLVRDEDECIRRVEREWETLATADEPIERLGRFARLPLAKAKYDGLSSRTVARLFMDAANAPGSKDDFHAAQTVLGELTENGEMPFSPAALRTFLTAYREAGEPPVSHSDVYRAAYAPSYRLITAVAARLLPVVAAVEHALAEKPHVTVAIDGRCASGKTTAARLLAEVFDASVVHLDDFFLPREMRTAERLAEPGGNIDYERVSREIIPHAGSGAGFAYRAYDCGAGALCPEPVTVPPSRLLVVEGSYALHPAFGGYADITVFSDVSPEEQLSRIVARGNDVTAFRSRWIPLEEQYFDAYGVRRRAGIVLP